jgi:hypothetical protein
VNGEFQARRGVGEARREDRRTFGSQPVDGSEENRELVGGLRRGFGSVRVRAAIGGSSWRTSIFPDAGRQSYVMPVKKAVRQAERLQAGDDALVVVETMDV